MSMYDKLIGWALCCIGLWIAAKYLEWKMIKRDRDRYEKN